MYTVVLVQCRMRLLSDSSMYFYVHSMLTNVHSMLINVHSMLFNVNQCHSGKAWHSGFTRSHVAIQELHKYILDRYNNPNLLISFLMLIVILYSLIFPNCIAFSKKLTFLRHDRAFSFIPCSAYSRNWSTPYE